MAFEAFHIKFPEIAEEETRTVTILDSSTDLPASEYVFMEMYCDEPNCDCRRVIFNVWCSKNEHYVAVINYGWENVEFYGKWLNEDDPDILNELKGPALNQLSPQSEIAPAILELFKNTLLTDSEYIDRIKRHYQLCRSKITPPKRTLFKHGKKKRRKR